MLPEGYVGLLIADTRRAMQWESGLAGAGFDVVRVETRGDDAAKGAWQIGVARRDRAAALCFVMEVTRGERALPGRVLLSRGGWIGLAGVAVILGAMLLYGWLG